ncbi:class I SAM-dependent methyltransferase, partial [Planctomycetota bacterium]
LVERLHPEIIVELGSGTSTLVAAYQVEKNGLGKVVAIDHDQTWGGITKDWIEEHGLSQWVEVRIAPLVPIEISDRLYYWYDLKVLDDVEKIDLLLIDGPPDRNGLGKRYPALPLLADRLSASGIIIVDDCKMLRWKTIVLEWASTNGFVVESRFLNEKDTLFLRRCEMAQIESGSKQKSS